MSQKCKSTLLIAIQVKNWPKTDGTEEELDVISQLEKVNEIVEICCNVRFAHISVHTIHNNADRIRESAKLGTKVFCVARLRKSCWNELYQNCGCKSLTFLLH